MFDDWVENGKGLHIWQCRIKETWDERLQQKFLWASLEQIFIKCCVYQILFPKYEENWPFLCLFFFFLHLHALFWFYTAFWTKYDSLWPFKIFSGLEKCGISKAEQHFSNLTLNIANCLLGIWVDSDVTSYCVNKILILLLHCFSDEVAGSSF